MADKILIEPDVLKDQVEKIESHGKKNKISYQHLEAKAEALLRLALHPDTSFAEALQYLKNAYRIDSANPRYAYHLARLYFRYNELDKSAFWLRKAILYCPTSHRIWTHIGLLHRELNSRYKYDDQYEPNALQMRAVRINAAIRQGNDQFDPELIDFKPPQSKAEKEKQERKKQDRAGSVREPDVSEKKEEPDESEKRPEDLLKTKMNRMNLPRRLRWSGILDIEMESLLEAAPSERIRDKILPLLDKVIEHCRKREAGHTAFAILGIEWLMSGYPVSTVQRYMTQYFSEDKDPSLELLKITFTLFEADLSDLPEMLNTHLTQGKITPLMAAQVHKRRLLWRSFDFRALTAYRMAKKLIEKAENNEELSEYEHSACARYMTSLTTALNKLDVPPPDPMPDTAVKEVLESIDVKTALEMLSDLEQCYQTFKSISEQAFNFLKNEFEPVSKSIESADSYTFVCSHHSGFEEFLSVLNQAGIAGIDAVDYLLDQIVSLPTSELGEDFALRLETCRKEFNELTIPKGFNKVLRRIELRMKSAAENFIASPPNYSPALSQLIEESRTAMPGVGQDHSGNGSKFEVIIDETQEIGDKIDLYWTSIRDLVSAHKDHDLTDEEVQKAVEIRDFIEGLEAWGENTLSQVEEIRKKNEMSDISKLDQLEKSIRDHMTAQGRFRKKIKTLHLPDLKPQQSTGENADDEVTADQSDDKLTGVEGLKRIISMVDTKVFEVIDDSLKTFDAYSVENRILAPISGLHRMVMEQATELIYRLGNVSRAKKLWSQCYAMDRLNINALKNIAVATTVEHNDYAKILHAWQSYFGITYFYAIAAQNPREYAETRAEIHHNFASAYGIEFITSIDRDKSDEEMKKDFEPFFSFMNSPGCLTEFIHHKIAEFLNKRFDLETPTLILGVERTATPGQREKAFKMMQLFVETACELLPKRISPGFQKTCLERLSKALDACEDLKGLTISENERYKEDEKKLVQWITDVYSFREQFFYAFQMNPDWFLSIRHIDFLPLLDLISIFPTGISKQYQMMGVGSFVRKYRKEPDVIINHLETIVDIASLNFASATIGSDQIEKGKRLKYYNMLYKSLCSHLEFWKRIGDRNEQGGAILKRIDDPQPLYPDEIQIIYQDQDLSQEDLNRAIDKFKEWCDIYPRITGPARMLGFLLRRQNKGKEALPYLEKAVKNAFFDHAIEECKELIGSINMPDNIEEYIDNADYAGARVYVKKQLMKQPTNQNLLQTLINCYARQIEDQPKDSDELFIDMELDIDDIKKTLDDSISKRSKDGLLIDPKAADVSLLNFMKNEDQWGTFLTESFISHYNQETLKNNWDNIIVLMGGLIEHYPENVNAKFYLMIAHFNLGNEDGQKQELEVLKKHWAEADRFSKEVIGKTENEDLIKSAQGVRNQIDRFREQLDL